MQSLSRCPGGGLLIPFFVTSVVLLAAFGAQPAAGAWEGEEVTRDGVVHVLNPESGVEPPRTIRLEELWRLGGDSESDAEFFGVIGAVATDKEGTVYLLDRQLTEVKLFDAAGKYIRTIGREGEGPGEFRGPTDMFLTSGGDVAVLQLRPGKIVLLTPEGEPAGEFYLPQPEGGGNQMLWSGTDAGGRFIIESSSMSLQATKGVRTTALAAYASSGEEAARYFQDSNELNFAVLEIDERKGIRPTWGVGTDGTVFVVPVFGEYEIHLFQPDGELDRIVERSFEHLERTQEEKEEQKSRFVIRGPVAEPKITVSDHHPDIARIFPREDGTFWVLTSRGRREAPTGALGVFDVFDERGRFVRQVILEGEGDPVGDAYFLAGDRLFVVTGFAQATRAMHAMDDRSKREDEEIDADLKPMEVICYSLGMKE
jgi:hypothetical protein